MPNDGKTLFQTGLSFRPSVREEIAHFSGSSARRELIEHVFEIRLRIEIVSSGTGTHAHQDRRDATEDKTGTSVLTAEQKCGAGRGVGGGAKV